MSIVEMNDQFDLLYNNITSNQAPGLNSYEKSVFLTKAEKEIVKNYFIASSKGNNTATGFDGSPKRQADFSILMKTGLCQLAGDQTGKIDDRSKVYTFPTDAYLIVNETIKTSEGNYVQVLPIKFDEYTRLMSKPFKRPLKNQAWRLLDSGTSQTNTTTKYAEILINTWDTISTYKVRYVRMPAPIILENLTDGLSIDGKSTASTVCELDPMLHEEVLQRAVELAKIAWAQENIQALTSAGQRSE